PSPLLFCATWCDAGAYRRGVPADEALDAALKRLIFQHIEQSTPAVLAARAVRPRRAALLVQVSKDGVRPRARGRYADLGVIEIRAPPACKPEALAFPLPGGCNLDITRIP